MANRMDPPDRAVRRDDTKNHFVVGLILQGTLESAFPLEPVVRMDARQALLPSRRSLSPIESVDPEPFFRQVHRRAVAGPPRPASCVCQFLRLGQVGFAAPDNLLGVL